MGEKRGRPLLCVTDYLRYPGTLSVRTKGRAYGAEITIRIDVGFRL